MDMAVKAMHRANMRNILLESLLCDVLNVLEVIKTVPNYE